jgi:oxygen-dependent protoporphyrinogen oxidase
VSEAKVPVRARRVAVVGAGPAGCAAAYALVRRGVDVVLFERERHVGGRTTSLRDGGIVIDSGAGFFTDFYPRFRRLLEELDLARDVVSLSRSNALVAEGRKVPFTLGSVSSFAAYPFVPARSKLRLAMAAARAMVEFRALDLAEPATLAPVDDVSVRDDAIERVGRDAYEYVVRPGIEPFWYFSCADVSRALYLALLARAATARFFTLRDGMDSFCRTVSARVETRTGSVVERVAVTPAGVALRLDGRELPGFDAVVVATTATVAEALVAEVDDAIVPPDVRAYLRSQRYVANTHVTFEMDANACPKETALFPCGPRASAAEGVAALSFNRAKGQAWPPAKNGREVVSVFLTATESGRTRDLDDAALAARAWALGRALCPSLPSQATMLHAVRRDEAIPVHAVGRYRAAASIEARQRPPVVFAGDYLATATVEGAVRSGLFAADRVAPPR